MLLSFRLKISTEYVRILGCYAPSDGDQPENFFKCKDILKKEKHGLIVGDLNTTLNPTLDRKNYKTDNHKRSRMVINNGIANEKIIDCYRFYQLK